MYTSYSMQQKKVQRKLLRYINFKLNIPYAPHNYELVAIHLGLVFLSKRRHVSGIEFLDGILR